MTQMTPCTFDFQEWIHARAHFIAPPCLPSTACRAEDREGTEERARQNVGSSGPALHSPPRPEAARRWGSIEERALRVPGARASAGRESLIRRPALFCSPLSA